jgi:hypothetical protein
MRYEVTFLASQFLKFIVIILVGNYIKWIDIMNYA